MPETIREPVSFLSLEEIEKQAQEILERHNLKTLPINPLTLAHRAGVKVNNARFTDENLAGMIVKRGDDVLILVAQDDPPFRKRFTIAHELAHHFLHLIRDGEYVDNEVDLFRLQTSDRSEASPTRRQEIQANLFAASLLMPEHEVRRYWDERRSIEDLARAFNVSEEAMGYRVTSLGLD